MTSVSFETFFNSIWSKIPDVWRDADPQTGYPLKLLMYTVAQQLYYNFYQKISALDELFDPDLCPEKYLPFLAGVVGWKLQGQDPVSWRAQIRSAPLLYKIKGTQKSLVLAESLVGYSVFLADLYRDYSGNFTTKPKIFNSIPERIKAKPWFRSTAVDLERTPNGSLNSYVFPSFNATFGDFDKFGSLVLPKAVKLISRKTVTLSTVRGYNPVTGANSLARFAKIPRINLVLKRIRPLDYVNPVTGRGENNLTEALDLLLQFKPFHIKIENLQVLFDLSDTILGSANNPSAGTSNEDTIFYRDLVDVSIIIPQNREDSVLYRNGYQQAEETVVETPEESPVPVFRLGGQVYTAAQIISAPIVTDISYLRQLGITNFSGYCINPANRLYASSDFSLQETSESETGFAYLSQFGDNFDTLSPSPVFSFRQLPIGIEALASLRAYLEAQYTNPEIDSVQTSIAPFSDKLTVSVSGNLVEDPGKFDFSFTTTPTVAAHDVYSETISAKLTGVTPTISLRTGEDFVVDFKNSYIIFNCYSIFQKLLASYPQLVTLAPNGYNLFFPSHSAPYFFTDAAYEISFDYAAWYRLDVDDLLDPQPQLAGTHQYYIRPFAVPGQFGEALLTSVISNIKLTWLESIQVFSEDSSQPISRDGYIANRAHNKYNRLSNLVDPRLDSVTTYAKPETISELVEVGGDFQVVSYQRLFKQSLPRLFTRRGLREEVVSNTTIVSIDDRNPRNVNSWQVYSEQAPSLYAGAEEIARGWWANFYNTPLGAPGNTVPYTSLDLSAEAQQVNKQSLRWKTAQTLIDESNPEHFLATRRRSSKRQAIWTRGSARTVSKPYISYARNKVQPFRGDVALFKRDENLPDYRISLRNIAGVSSYKYGDSSFDYTLMYINPTRAEEITTFPYTFTRVQPTTPEFRVQVTGSEIVYPVVNQDVTTSIGYTPQFDYAYDFTSRNKYYGEGSLIPKFSFYANNIRTDVDVSSLQLIDDSNDSLEILASGINEHYDQFSYVDGTEGTLALTQTELPLTYNNLYIIWRRVNTGDAVGLGYFPDTDVLNEARPNIKVFHNGLEIPYGTLWQLKSYPASIELLPACSLAKHDSIRVEYFTFDDSTEQLTAPILTNPQTVIRTILQSDLNLASNYTNIYSYALEIQFPVSPYIVWTANTIFTGVSLASAPTNVVPYPRFRHTESVPNIQVSVLRAVDLSEQSLVFGLDWTFVAVPGTVSWRIQVLPHIAGTLLLNDQIKVIFYSA